MHPILKLLVQRIALGLLLLLAVSAVIFLYGPDTKPASVAVVHMDEAGQASAAAGMP